MNPTDMHEDSGVIPALDEQVKGSDVAVSCGVDLGGGPSITLLWLWCSLAIVAPIWPLLWDTPYATGAALKSKKKKKRSK